MAIICLSKIVKLFYILNQQLLKDLCKLFVMSSACSCILECNVKLKHSYFPLIYFAM